MSQSVILSRPNAPAPMMEDVNYRHSERAGEESPSEARDPLRRRGIAHPPSTPPSRNDSCVIGDRFAGEPC